MFIGTHVNKVDRKGRISVPHAFRQALGTQAFDGIIVFESFQAKAIQACGYDFLERISEGIDTLNLFSTEQDDLATAILASSYQLAFDGEGRVVLPAELREAVGIGERAAFVGKGSMFQIWDPEAQRTHMAEARARAKSDGRSLSLPRPRGSESRSSES